MINLDLLKVFISVAENAGFTRAAVELHRSQSAISMQIKRLEEVLGVAVFDRNSKNIVLTPEGVVFIEYARRILRLVDEAFGAVNAKSRAHNVRLGCIEDYAARILPKILVKFWREHPEVRIEVRTGETWELLDRLGQEYDLVLAMHPLASGEGAIVCPDALVWATSETRSPHEDDPLPVALRPQGCVEREWATMALDTAGRPWRCAFVSSGIGTLQRAVEEGLAVGVFKESTIAGSLRRLTLKDGFPELPAVEIALHRSSSSLSNPVVTRLADALSERLKQHVAAARGGHRD